MTHSVHTRLKRYARGAITAPFGYAGRDGIYKGLTPTGESILGCGELQVVIERDHILILIATGIEVQTAATKRCDWREMRPDEILKMFTGTDVSDVTGLTYETSGISLLFLREEPEAPNVLITGLFGYEAFGPSHLFTPAAVANGDFSRMIEKTEWEACAFGRDGLPRLSAAGRTF